MPTVAQIKGRLKFYTKPYVRQWKYRYQVHGHFIEPKLKIPDELVKQNVNIIDPLKEQMEAKKKLSMSGEPWLPPKRNPMLEHFFPKPDIKNHPNYHSNGVFLVDKTVKLHAGVDQACLLTKTMPVYDLPERIKTKLGTFKIQNEVNLKSLFKKKSKISSLTLSLECFNRILYKTSAGV